jgi:hypothetical protein
MYSCEQCILLKTKCATSDGTGCILNFRVYHDFFITLLDPKEFNMKNLQDVKFCCVHGNSNGGIKKQAACQSVLQWLNIMTLFCTELYAFMVSGVPADASPCDCTSSPSKLHAYGNPLAAWVGMPSIKSLAAHQTSAEDLWSLWSEAQQTPCIWCVHVLRKQAHANQQGCKIILRKPLFICMVLGVEHSWIKLQACRSKARTYLSHHSH